MMDVTLYRLSIPFAIVTGTGAGIIAALTREVLRELPFGVALELLAVVMSIATVYHGGLLVLGSGSLALKSLQLIGYLFVLIALLAAIADLWGGNAHAGAVNHRTVFHATVLGLLLYAVGGLLSELFYPSVLHWVHGAAGLFAMAGLYGPVHTDLGAESRNGQLSTDVSNGRRRAEWIVQTDDALLAVLSSSGLTLTPAVIAYNIDRSREEVNRRLTKLASEGFVERVERGKYRSTARGDRLESGEFGAAE